MDRWDFYYRQKVLEDELDSAFNAGEVADQALATDLDFAARTPAASKGDYGGIAWGFDVTNLGSGLQVSVDPGAGYDESGRRVAVDTTLTLTLSKDGVTDVGSGGTPDGSAIDPGTGNERWLSLFVVYGRELSQQRYDGYNNPVWYSRAESFYFEISAGPIQTIGALNYTTHKPARQDDKILLEDLRVVNAAGTPDITEIDAGTDTRRTEFFFDVAASSTPYKRIRWKGNIRDVMAEMLGFYNDHIGGHADKHPAGDLTWSTTQVWADSSPGATGVSTNVDEALQGIMADMKAIEPAGGGRPGTANIGGKASTGSTLNAPVYTAPYELSQETLEGQLWLIKEELNGRICRGGDLELKGNFAPDINGRELGQDAGGKWDAYLRDLKVAQYVKNWLIPDTTNAYDLGDDTHRWRNLYVHNYIKNAGRMDNLGDMDIDGWIDVAGRGDFRGENKFYDTTTVEAPDSNDGLILTLSGAAMNGGYLLQLKNKVATTPQPFMKVDKHGALTHTPFFFDNFQHYAWKLASSTLSDHVPDTRWEGFSGFSSPDYSIGGGGSNAQCMQVFGTVPETGPKSVGLETGASWEIGQLRSVCATFVMGPAYTGIPQASEKIVGGFVGFFYGVEVLVRMDLNGAWGYFDNGTSIAWGAVNLMTGPPVANGRYMFRILIIANNAVIVQGPSGYEALVSPSGTMNAGETANFNFYFERSSGAYAGRGANFYHVCINEQQTYDLG